MKKLKISHKIWIITGIIFAWWYGVQNATQTDQWQLWGENKVFMLRSPTGELLAAGNHHSTYNRISSALSSWWSRTTPTSIEPKHNFHYWETEGGHAKKIINGLWAGEFGGQDMMFWLKNQPTAEQLAQLTVSLRSDFWVISDASPALTVPPPRKAILFLGSQKPNQAWQNYAKSHRLPLVDSLSTGGFRLKWPEQDWQLYTRYPEII